MRNLNIHTDKTTILVLGMFVVLIGFLILNPTNSLLLDIAREINKNTDRNYQELRIIHNQTQSSESQRLENVSKIALLYLIDIEQELDRNNQAHNITAIDKIKINDTHIIVANNRTITLPEYVDVILAD